MSYDHNSLSSTAFYGDDNLAMRQQHSWVQGAWHRQGKEELSCSVTALKHDIMQLVQTVHGLVDMSR